MAALSKQFATVYHTNLAGDDPGGDWLHAGSRGQAANRLKQVEESLKGYGFDHPLIGKVSAADQRAATKEHVMFGRELDPVTFRLEVTGRAMNTPRTPVTDQFANVVTRPVEEIQKEAKDLHGIDLSHGDALLKKLDHAVSIAERDHWRGERYQTYRGLSSEGFDEHHYRVSPTQYDILNRMLDGEDGPVWYLNSGEGLSMFDEGEFPKEHDANASAIRASVALPRDSYRVAASHRGGPNFSDPPSAFDPADAADTSSLEGVHRWVDRAYPHGIGLRTSVRDDGNIEMTTRQHIGERRSNDVVSLLTQHADRAGRGIVVPDTIWPEQRALLEPHGFQFVPGDAVSRNPEMFRPRGGAR